MGVGLELPLHVRPAILDGVQVWRVPWLVDDLELLRLLEEGLDELTLMAGGAILEEKGRPVNSHEGRRWSSSTFLYRSPFIVQFLGRK